MCGIHYMNPLCDSVLFQIAGPESNQFNQVFIYLMFIHFYIYICCLLFVGDTNFAVIVFNTHSLLRCNLWIITEFEIINDGISVSNRGLFNSYTSRNINTKYFSLVTNGKEQNGAKIWLWNKWRELSSLWTGSVSMFGSLDMILQDKGILLTTFQTFLSYGTGKTKHFFISANSTSLQSYKYRCSNLHFLERQRLACRSNGCWGLHLCDYKILFCKNEAVKVTCHGTKFLQLLFFCSSFDFLFFCRLGFTAKRPSTVLYEKCFSFGWLQSCGFYLGLKSCRWDIQTNITNNKNTRATKKSFLKDYDDYG